MFINTDEELNGRTSAIDQGKSVEYVELVGARGGRIYTANGAYPIEL